MKKFLSSIVLAAATFMPLAANAAVTVADGDLVKGSLDTVYYYYNGSRYVFPTEKTYKSWYSDFSTVKTISDSQLQTYPLGRQNVTYRPGVQLLKITTDPKVYAVSKGGKLRWVATEAVAKILFGNDWAKKVHDLPDPFFINYTVGDAINSPSDYNPQAEQDAAKTIWQDKSFAAPV